MAFSSGSSNQPEINVTPLIDVLLVLIIIFMIIVPQKPDGLRAVVPQPPTHNTTPQPPDTTIVVEVQSHAGAAPTYAINQQPVAKDSLIAKLTGIFATRQDRTMFVKGDADLEFNSIAEVVSMGRRARVDNIGVLTPKGQASM